MLRSLNLRPADAVTLAFVLLLCLLEVMFSGFISVWPYYLTGNILLMVFILAMAQRGERASPVVRFIRDWYYVPGILFIYTQASTINHPIHQRDFDNLLIAADLRVFGMNPTHQIIRFAHPVLTEILQIAYSSYYFIFIALFAELHRRPDRRMFDSGIFMVAYGFYLSYIGYLLVPAIGPRFTLHDFRSIGTELPGLWLTPYLRALIDSGGGVPPGVADAAAYVHRDAFPSGHTQLTLVAIYLAFYYRTRNRWVLTVFGALLIVSTIYMWYHYVTDVAAGILFFLFTIWSGKRIERWWQAGIKNV